MRITDLFERILLINILLFFFLGGLFFIAETSWTHDGIIEHGDHKYTVRDMAELNGKGRITGRAQNAPDFKVTVLTSTIQPVRIVESEKLDNGGKVYKVQLEPGNYILAVDAEGYETLDIKNLEVRTGQDLELDLKFSKKQT
jgi:hypothetical protein